MDTIKAERFRGINNRLPADRLRKLGERADGVFVADAVNVDLTDAGTFQRRPGRTRVGSDENCRGLFSMGSHGYYASGDTLKMLDGNGLAVDVVTLVSPHANLSYAETPMGVVCSDGFKLYLLNRDAVSRVMPEAPNPPPYPIVVPNSGGLRAGLYGFSFACVVDGVRSRMTYPEFISVPEGASIELPMLMKPDDVAVFITAPDGEIFYREATIAAGFTTLTISGVTGRGEPVAYVVQERLPAGNLMGYFNGRLLAATGALLHIGMPYSPGLYRPGIDYIAMPETITLLAAADDGLWLATAKATYFLPGGDPLKAKLDQVAPYGAIPGTATRMPDSQDWMWFTERGPVRASGGALTALQNEQIAFAPAEAGAAIVREENGLRSFVASLAGAAPAGGAVMGSYIDAEIITQGTT